MGREAECACVWGAAEVQVKALLESNEIILRGGMRRHLPFAALESVRVEGETLTFRVGGERVALSLGARTAEKWATATQTPPPSLGKKLGVHPGIAVRLLGDLDEPELEAALTGAKVVSRGSAALILARVDTPEFLAAALEQVRSETSQGAALWVIYPKGSGQLLGEAAVLAMGRAAGLTDTKVVSVSRKLTGLRFIQKRLPCAALAPPANQAQQTGRMLTSAPPPSKRRQVRPVR